MTCQTSSTSSAPANPSASSSQYNTTSSLQVTALVGQSNQTALQCWKVHPEYQYGIGDAKIQQLGDISSVLLFTFDQKTSTYVGVQPSSAPQYVLLIYLVSIFNCVNRWLVVLSGGGYFRLPASKQYFGVSKGKLLILNDTAAVSYGHDTVWFPGSVIMQLPFAQGQVNHSVLYNGPCSSYSLE